MKRIQNTYHSDDPLSSCLRFISFSLSSHKDISRISLFPSKSKLIIYNISDGVIETHIWKKP